MRIEIRMNKSGKYRRKLYPLLKNRAKNKEISDITKARHCKNSVANTHQTTNIQSSPTFAEANKSSKEVTIQTH